MKVVFFHRKPHTSGNFSIESYFERIRSLLPPHIIPLTAVSRFSSQGIFRRFYNALEAAFRQGDVNHITGDVHFLAIFLKKYKTILTVHDLGFMDRTTGLKQALLRLFWLTLPARKCRFITTVSESTRTELLKYVSFPEERVLVIPVFVSAVFQPFPKAFDATCPRILQLGTAPNKNLFRLIEALSGINCTLVVIGRLSAEQQAALEKYNIAYENHVALTQVQVLEQYQLCDVVTLVSTLEGFGMPIVEANCVERVVITGNVSSMPEIAGEAACLTDPFDATAIRKSILKVLEDAPYRQHLLEKGRQNRLRFQPEAIVSSYVSLYDKINAPF